MIDALGLGNVWKAAATGAGLLLLCSWAFGAWMNWRANMRVRDEVYKNGLLLGLILDHLVEVSDLAKKDKKVEGPKDPKPKLGHHR